jgi:hypothetical protein
MPSKRRRFPERVRSGGVAIEREEVLEARGEVIGAFRGRATRG